MKVLLRAAPVVAVLCLVAWPVQAADGILITEKTTGAGHTSTNRIQIEQHRMRVESTGEAGGHRAFIFDGTKQVMWILDLDHRSYKEMTKADLERVSQQMSAAMARMQEQLKNMPPEQRKRMEEMMKNMPGMSGAGAAAMTVPQTEYRKTGTATVGKWRCQQYEGYRDGTKVAEVCTVPPATLGFSAADFEVSRQIADFFRQLMPKDADRMFSLGSGGDNGQGFSGIPVQRIDLTPNGRIVTEITDISRQSFADSTFEVPAGFRKEALGLGPRH